jgi:GT2 family glycosyltransferase
VVVVVNWNGRRHLADCFGSLERCGYRPLRVVMVDNGSEDDSVAFTRERFPGVEVVALPENRRWAGGNNVLIRRLREEGIAGRYLLLLNNDTVVTEGSLERLLAAARREPSAWLATPRICYADRPTHVWYDGGVVGSRTGWIRHAGIRRPVADLAAENRFVDYGTGCALLLAPPALERLGELDEAYHLYAEDADYSLRARAAGGRILHVPSAVILHKVSAALGAGSPRKAYLRSRSHVKLLGRHWRPRQWPLLAIAQLFYFAGWFGWYAVRGRVATGWAAVRGACDELRGVPLDQDEA